MPRYKKAGRKKNYAKRRAIAKELKSNYFAPISDIAKTYKTSTRLIQEVRKNLNRYK